MAELTTEQLVAKVASGVEELQTKSAKHGSDTAEVKEMAQKVASDVILLNTSIAEAKTLAEEHKARIEHLESVGLKHQTSFTADDIREISTLAIMEEMKGLAGSESKSLSGRDKREVKSFYGSDYTATDGARGGVFVTPQIMNEIIMKGMREINPILNELNITTHDTSAPVSIFIKNGDGVAAWAGEQQDAPKGNKPRWSTIDIPMHRYTGYGACTMEVLSGTTIDFRAQVLDDIMIELSNAQKDAFTTGAGIGKFSKKLLFTCFTRLPPFIKRYIHSALFGSVRPANGEPKVMICCIISGRSLAAWRAKTPPKLQPIKLMGFPVLA